eukprot:1197816-Amphidinium_carterae.1
MFLFSHLGLSHDAAERDDSVIKRYANLCSTYGASTHQREEAQFSLCDNVRVPQSLKQTEQSALLQKATEQSAHLL